MCWTNAIPMMPPYGSRDIRLGNNPLVLAVPRREGPVVLDIAMSQFSFGKMEVVSRRGEKLPVPGGFDREGQPTQDAAVILESGRALPIGDLEARVVVRLVQTTPPDFGKRMNQTTPETLEEGLSGTDGLPLKMEF